MAHFKVPRHVWFVKEFPMTVTGKVQKFRMKEIAAAGLAGEKGKDGKRCAARVS